MIFPFSLLTITPMYNIPLFPTNYNYIISPYSLLTTSKNLRLDFVIPETLLRGSES